jgi:hypothetical protein
VQCNIFKQNLCQISSWSNVLRRSSNPHQRQQQGMQQVWLGPFIGEAQANPGNLPVSTEKAMGLWVLREQEQPASAWPFG